MARRAAAPAGPVGDDFSFVSPVAKYLLFFFNLLFWVISMVMVAVGVYARLLKHAEAAMACLAVDPAILLVVVGVLTFLITFCGCVGSLRENICLLRMFSVCLTVVFLLQLAAGVLGFVFSDKVLGGWVTPMLSRWVTTSLVSPRLSPRHAGRSASSSMGPSCITGMTWTCRTSLISGRRSSAAAGVSPTRTGPRTCTSTAPPPTPATSAAPCPSPAACATPARPSSTPCVATGCRPGATWRPVPSSTPTAASTSWSTGPTATSSCWGASPWGWPCPSWWASSWRSSSSTRSATRSSCSSTTSSTGQTPGTEPAPGSPRAFPNPGSAGRAGGALLKKRECREGCAGTVETPCLWQPVLGSARMC